MEETVKQHIREYAASLKERFGEEIRGIILYGSYARGDYRESSDIDIMVLTDTEEGEMSDFRIRLYDFTYDFNNAHGTMIMPASANRGSFISRAGFYPFYGNIVKEGIELYAS